MPRPSRPWFRSDRDAWYAWIGGKRVKLADGKDGHDAAMKAFYKLKAAGPVPLAPSGGYTTGGLCLLYLDHARDDLAPLTYEWYARHLKSLARACGDVPADDLRPHHVLAWVGSHGWGPTTRNGAIRAARRVFSWATKQGHIAADPIRLVERPRPLRREDIPEPKQMELVMEVVRDRPFHDLLAALWETGCRPGEAFALTAAGVDLDGGTWTVVNKTRHRGDPTRTVYLTPRLVELSRRLVVEWPEGPIFRNTRGQPWRRNALACRFRRLRARLGMGRELTAYALRHLFITDGLEKEVPIATMAELVGHKDGRMITTVYSKLSRRKQHLRDAARKVRPDDQGP
jgi:integrase